MSAHPAPASRRSTRSSATLLASAPLPAFKATKRSLTLADDDEKLVKAEDTHETVKAEEADQPVVQVRGKKKRRKGDYADLGDDPLTDRIKEGLLALACGENPGVRTAELQLHYASPANHFYRCLHAARLTPSVLPPTASRTIHEDHHLGITNLVARPTKEASELTKEELDKGVPVMLRKVARYKPKVVFFVGMKVADTVLAYFVRLSAPPPPAAPDPPKPLKSKGRAKKPPASKAAIGWLPFALQHAPEEEGMEGEKTYFYCLPSTSGRVAAYPLPVKLKLWAAFGDEVAKLRSTPPLPLSLPPDLVYYDTAALGLLDEVTDEAQAKAELNEVVKVETGTVGAVVEGASVIPGQLEEQLKEEVL
ncbi:hypothetical protein JCM8097_002289 [Rhodosporidiobolus ruineniae]